MTSSKREIIRLKNQRRARLMLEHILSRLDGKEELVHLWLCKFATPHRSGLLEWQSFPDWKEKLTWMLASIESDWDEVERLMSNHPFTCIIDQDVRNAILS